MKRTNETNETSETKGYVDTLQSENGNRDMETRYDRLFVLLVRSHRETRITNSVTTIVNAGFTGFLFKKAKTSETSKTSGTNGGTEYGEARTTVRTGREVGNTKSHYERKEIGRHYGKSGIGTYVTRNRM